MAALKNNQRVISAFPAQPSEKAQQETDDFSDIDPAAVRAALAENGIVDGHVVDPDKLAANPFIQQVMADVEQIEQEAPQELAEKTADTEKNAARPANERSPEGMETPLAPPAPRRRGKAAPAVLHPEIAGADRHEYQITDDAIGVGTPGERFNNNVRAIRLLKKLERENRLATPEEQAVLARYVGWGGLADCFDERHSKYAELKALLTEDEYAAARESTLTAFYTPPVVIRSIYQALENIKLTGARRHNVILGPDIFGNIVRLDNLLNGFEYELESVQHDLSTYETQLASAKVEVEKPFPQEDELKTKTARLNELNSLLNLDKKENEIVDGEPNEGEAPVKDAPDRER